MNDLQHYFQNNSGRRIHKWNHYFDIYERYFRKYRGREVVVLEIGVYHGGSLQMWKNYFGRYAKIYGVDINPKCKQIEEEQIEVFIGSQEDPLFLRKLVSRIPKIDILIDDGGHTMDQQKVTFKELFPHVKDDGVYLCEDTHTSYWDSYGGGYKAPQSFIEFTKDLIDQLNAYHSQDDRLRVNDFTKSVSGIHFYDSVVVIEKKPVVPPTHKMTGTQSF